MCVLRFQARQGSGKALLGGAGLGSTHCGEESPQKSGKAWTGKASHGAARPGVARQTHCISRGAEVCLAWPGTARPGEVWRGKYTASHGVSQFGAAWPGTVRFGWAWWGAANTLLFKEGRSLRLGVAGPGRARRGGVRLGQANTQHPHGGAEVC
jgi:hypothetical protein